MTLGFNMTGFRANAMEQMNQRVHNRRRDMSPAQNRLDFERAQRQRYFEGQQAKQTIRDQRLSAIRTDPFKMKTAMDTYYGVPNQPPPPQDTLWSRYNSSSQIDDIAKRRGLTMSDIEREMNQGIDPETGRPLVMPKAPPVGDVSPTGLMRMPIANRARDTDPVNLWFKGAQADMARPIQNFNAVQTGVGRGQAEIGGLRAQTALTNRTAEGMGLANEDMRRNIAAKDRPYMMDNPSVRDWLARKPELAQQMQVFDRMMQSQDAQQRTAALSQLAQTVLAENSGAPDEVKKAVSAMMLKEMMQRVGINPNLAQPQQKEEGSGVDWARIGVAGIPIIGPMAELYRALYSGQEVPVPSMAGARRNIAQIRDRLGM